MLELLYCPVCHDEVEAEPLPCADGHGGDCAERVCVTCSTAVFAGVVPLVRPLRRSPAA